MRSNPIENPDAYYAAKAARIKANASITRRRKLIEAVKFDSPEFRIWLGLEAAPWDDPDGSEESYRAQREGWKSFTATYGWKPDFISKAMDDWGGLTDGQLAYARKAFAEKAAKGAERSKEETDRRAKAPAWVEGRQSVTGLLASARVDDSDFGPTLKGMVKLTDGRLLWTSLPGAWRSDYKDYVGREITMSVKVTQRKGDPTFGFGSRPTKVETHTVANA